MRAEGEVDYVPLYTQLLRPVTAAPRPQDPTSSDDQNSLQSYSCEPRRASRGAKDRIPTWSMLRLYGVAIAVE
jgi:hypothetical protein